MDSQRRRYNTDSFYELLETGLQALRHPRVAAPGDVWRDLIGLLWLSAGTESGYFSEQDVMSRVQELGIPEAAQGAWIELSRDYQVVGALESEWLLRIDFCRRPVREQKIRLLRESSVAAAFEAVLLTCTSALWGDANVMSLADDLMFDPRSTGNVRFDEEVGQPFLDAAARWMTDPTGFDEQSAEGKATPAERLVDTLKYMTSVADVLAGLNRSDLIHESLRQEYLPDLNLLATAGIRIAEGQPRLRFNTLCDRFFQRYAALAKVHVDETATIQAELTRLMRFWDECTQFTPSGVASAV